MIFQEPMIVPLLRDNDRYIMDIVMTTGWPPECIDCINACRRYLQATTLSDITNAKGTEIQHDAWDGSRQVTTATYRGIMFNQIKPHKNAWKQWTRFLRTISTPQKRLHAGLGRWKVTSTDVRHPTKWVYDPDQDQLYQQVDRSINYRACPRTAPRLFQPTDEACPSTLAQGYPTWVHETAIGISPMHAFHNVNQDPPPNTFWNYIQNLPQWEQVLLQHTTLPQSPEETIAQLNMGPIAAASDGSVRTPFATFGYVQWPENNQRTWPCSRIRSNLIAKRSLWMSGRV